MNSLKGISQERILETFLDQPSNKYQRDFLSFLTSLTTERKSRGTTRKKKRTETL